MQMIEVESADTHDQMSGALLHALTLWRDTDGAYYLARHNCVTGWTSSPDGSQSQSPLWSDVSIRAVGARYEVEAEARAAFAEARGEGPAPWQEVPPQDSFRATLEALREARGMSQREVSALRGMSEGAYGVALRGGMSETTFLEWASAIVGRPVRLQVAVVPG